MKPTLLFAALLASCGAPPAPSTKPSAVAASLPAATPDPPAAALPDLGALTTAELGEPVASRKKLCPPKKKGSDVGITCQCFAIGDGSSVASELDPDAAACGASLLPTEGTITSVQFMGVQDTSAPDDDGESSISAELMLLLQTKDGIYTAPIGAASLEPGLGYNVGYTLRSLEQQDVSPGGDKELIAIFNEESSEFSDAGQKLSSTGTLMLCGVGASRRPSCAGLSLGAAQRDGYELRPKFEAGRLLLLPAVAKLSEEAKKSAGSYALSFP